ncbi:MAG: glutamine transporter ATP-binding protein [Acidimicrobiales bacterium]|nr:glutamine transporter ATP-binding protein [Acidimicrobiales bacterium]
MTMLEVRDLTVEFNSGGYVVRPLDGLDVDAEDGELVVLLGPSGCGKTTLLSCIAGLLTATSGTIRFAGRETSALTGVDLAAHRRHTDGVVFQAFNLIPSLTAKGNVMAPMRLAGINRRQAAARAEALLGQVGLAERVDHRPGALSGGQQQRVAIARSLVHDPPLLLADEPTAHLDHIQVEGVLTLLRDLASPGRVVVVSTHDDRVTQLADRVVELVPTTSSPDREPELLELPAGAIVFEQGSRGDLIYTVESGQIEVFRQRADGTEEPVAVVGPGDYFGELGPMLNLPRSATARAATDARLTAYTEHRFRRRIPTDPPAPPSV